MKVRIDIGVLQKTIREASPFVIFVGMLGVALTDKFFYSIGVALLGIIMLVVGSIEFRPCENADEAGE
jgi:hypothetical protein